MSFRFQPWLTGNKSYKSWHWHTHAHTHTVYLLQKIQTMWCLLAGLWRRSVTTANEPETKGGFPETLSNQDIGNRTLPFKHTHTETHAHSRTFMHTPSREISWSSVILLIFLTPWVPLCLALHDPMLTNTHTHTHAHMHTHQHNTQHIPTHSVTHFCSLASLICPL